jgi:hypothetical protein
MVATESTKVIPPPQVSFRTFLNFLDRLESSGIPQRINRNYWGDFLNGTTGHQLVVSLRFLNLVDGEDCEPNGDLERLVPQAQRKQALTEILRQRYAPILANADLARTTLGDLSSEFTKQYKVENDTRRKAVTFLVHAAKYAEVPLSATLSGKIKPRRAPARPAARRRTTTGAQTSRAEQANAKRNAPPAPNGQGGTIKQIKFQRGGEVTLSVTINPFDLTAEEDDFLRDLVTLVRNFEQGIVEDDLLDDEEDEGDEEF